MKYNDMTAEEIIEIVNKFNQEIFDQTESNEYGELIYPLSVNFYFCEIAEITFFDNSIWNSDKDGREYIDDKDGREDLESYLRREINKYISIISMIKL